MAVPMPISHIAATDGPGCATHVAPSARRPVTHAARKPTTKAMKSARKNDATPTVTLRAVVSPSRRRTSAAATTRTSIRIDSVIDQRCGHQTTKNERTSNHTALSSEVRRSSVEASARAIARRCSPWCCSVDGVRCARSSSGVW